MCRNIRCDVFFVFMGVYGVRTKQGLICRMRIEPPCQEFKEAEAGGSVQTTSSQSYRRLAERRWRPRRQSGHRLRLHESSIGELLRPAWSGSNGRDPNGAAVFVVNSTTPPHLGSLPLSTRDLRGPSIHIHITLMWGLG